MGCWPVSTLVVVALTQILTTLAQVIDDSPECRLCPETCLTVPRTDGSCPICICNGAALPDCPELPDFCPRNCVLQRNSDGCNQCACMRENPIICPPIPACPEECQQIMDEDGCPRCICEALPRTCPEITCPDGCTEELGSDGCISCRCQRTEICPAMQPCLRGCIENDSDTGCFFCNCTLAPDDSTIPRVENQSGIGPFGSRPSDAEPVTENRPRPPIPINRCRNERLFCPSDCLIVVASHGCRECVCGENAYLCPGVPRCSNRCLFLSPEDKCCRCDCRGPRPVTGVLTITVVRVPSFKPGRPFIPFGTFGPDIDFDEIPFLPPVTPRQPGTNCTVDTSRCSSECRIIRDFDGCPQCDCPGDLCPKIRCPSRCVTEIAPNGCPVCNCRGGPTPIDPDSEILDPFGLDGPALPDLPGVPLIPISPTEPANPNFPMRPDNSRDPPGKPLIPATSFNPPGTLATPESSGNPMIEKDLDERGNPMTPNFPMRPNEPRDPLGNPLIPAASFNPPGTPATPETSGNPVKEKDLDEPGNPMTPIVPLGTSNPMVPLDPAGQLNPVRPQGSGSDKPMVSMTPTESVNPMMPTEPGSGDTIMALNPSESDNPKIPMEPEGLGDPMMSVVPGGIGNPTMPMEPENPTNLKIPLDPSESANPMIPIEPNMLNSPSDAPLNSAEPENPSVPVAADASVNPVSSSKTPNNDFPIVSTVPENPTVPTDPNMTMPAEQPVETVNSSPTNTQAIPAEMPVEVVKSPPPNTQAIPAEQPVETVNSPPPNTQAMPNIPDDTESFFESTLRTSGSRIPAPEGEVNNGQGESITSNGMKVAQDSKDNPPVLNIENDNDIQRDNSPEQNNVDPGLVITP